VKGGGKLADTAGVQVEGHPQREYLRRFHTQVRDAIRRSGYSRAEVAKKAGVSLPTLLSWMYGARFPMLDNATQLASVLDEPGLVNLVRVHRTRPCLNCGAPVVKDKPKSNGSRYCSALCLKVHNKTWKGNEDKKAARFEHLASELKVVVNAHRTAITSFCRGCEPEGLCRNAKCPLRPVSPLPLARSVA